MAPIEFSKPTRQHCNLPSPTTESLVSRVNKVAMAKFITDQRKLLKLAFGLSVDIDFLIERIKADPATLDELSRTQLFEGIFSFLSEAVGLKEVQQYLVSKNLDQKTATVAKPGNPVGAAIASPARGNLTPPSRPKGSEKSKPVQNNSTTSTSGRAALPGGHCIIVSNTPESLGSLSGKVYGGPLERIIRNPPGYQGHHHGRSFLINFIDRKAAVAFLAYSKSPLGKKNLSGSGMEFVVKWHNMGDFHNGPVINAARRQVNPARRALVFQCSVAPLTGLKGQLMGILKTCDPRFMGEFALEECRITPNKKEAHVLFNCIEAAMKVMELHKRSLFGQPYDGYELVFGVDPCERPLPVMPPLPPPSLPPPSSKANAAITPINQAERMEQKKLECPERLKNQTGRVLTFSNYPWNLVSKEEVKRRFQTLDTRFFFENPVALFDVFPLTARAVLVFNNAETATKVLDFYRAGLLGAEFENSQIFLGSGPAVLEASASVGDTALGNTSAPDKVFRPSGMPPTLISSAASITTPMASGPLTAPLLKSGAPIAFFSLSSIADYRASPTSVSSISMDSVHLDLDIS